MLAFYWAAVGYDFPICIESRCSKTIQINYSSLPAGHLFAHMPTASSCNVRDAYSKVLWIFDTREPFWMAVDKTVPCRISLHSGTDLHGPIRLIRFPWNRIWILVVVCVCVLPASIQHSLDLLDVSDWYPNMMSSRQTDSLYHLWNTWKNTKFSSTFILNHHNRKGQYDSTNSWHIAFPSEIFNSKRRNISFVEPELSCTETTHAHSRNCCACRVLLNNGLRRQAIYFRTMSV